ncbi:MAG: O-antigen ligase family protein [Proteobacteria bacterium]|nr:O-antigen ligase family protein [Pseudomonadota bacterium]
MKDENSIRYLKDNSSTQQKVCFISFVMVIFLLPFSRTVELPMLVLSVLGIMQLFKPGLIKQPVIKAFTVVYVCYFGMIFLSVFDSYWMEKTAIVALASLRFYFAGIAVLSLLNSKHYNNLLIKIIAIIAMAWTIDASIQYATGFDLFGRESYPGRLTGIFAGNVKLGPILSILLPLYLIWISSAINRSWSRWLLIFLLIVVVVLSGSRSAWIMSGFVLLMYWWHHVHGRRWLLLLKTTVLATVLMVALWLVSSDFQQRMDKTLVLFKGDTTSIDFALADRLPIWSAAYNMFNAHPVNGVGAHAFRKAYSHYANSGDVWVNVGAGAMHAHHWTLEVLAETGIIGFMLFIYAAFTLFKTSKTSFHEKTVWPYATALMAVFLPVISVYSMFSAFWSICIWWLIIALFMGIKNE